jgi:hypothetical protein
MVIRTLLSTMPVLMAWQVSPAILWSLSFFEVVFELQ